MTRYFYDPRLAGKDWKNGMLYMVTVYQWKWWYRFKRGYKYPVPITSIVGYDYREVVKRAQSIVESYKKHN